MPSLEEINKLTRTYFEMMYEMEYFICFYHVEFMHAVSKFKGLDEVADGGRNQAALRSR